MDKTNNYIRKLFHILTLFLIIISLYPGSIAGFILYGSFTVQLPEITNNLIFISSNHFYIYFLISFIGFFSYLRDSKFKIIVIYLFFLSIILELLHFVIPERTFQIIDLGGNIFGVLVTYIIAIIYKTWKKE